jgi:hypothetical protein
MGRLDGGRIAGGALLALLAACSGSISSMDERTPGAPGASSVNGPGSGVNGPSGDGPAGSNANAPGGSDENGDGTDPMNGGAPGAVQALRCETKAVGPSPMRRLTHTEYDNAVRDLLGDTTQPARDFAVDTQVGLFDNTASAQTVPVLLGDQYVDAAVTLAERIGDVGAFAGCDPAGAAGAACVSGFVDAFGRRAYRRPLTAAERDGLIAIYDDVRAASDADTGIRAVVTAALTSPNFLFKPEFGAGAETLPGALQVTPFELAARLASLLWASIPDDALLDAAQGGQLETREQVQAQARRMLEDPRAQAAIDAFYEQWLGLPLLDAATKDAAIYPAWSDSLRAAMREETRRFIDHVLWDDDARLNTLLTAPYSFLNAELATLYGVSGGGKDAATFEKTMLDTSQRTGVLTQASLMATFASPSGSSPIKRGKLVRVRVLCQDLPDPPANVPPPPPPKQGVSTRERFAMHTDNDACRGCHDLIDGLGFGLEAYDGVGAFRTLDQGVAVDASGEVNHTLDIDGTYSGGPALANRLASSEQVRDCVPTQWLRYALARREGEDDACSLVQLREAFAASDGDLRELMIALTQTDAFWNYRKPE